MGAPSPRGILAEPIRVVFDGTVAVPDAPGLGIGLDEDKLTHYGKKYLDHLAGHRDKDRP